MIPPVPIACAIHACALLAWRKYKTKLAILACAASFIIMLIAGIITKDK